MHISVWTMQSLTEEITCTQTSNKWWATVVSLTEFYRECKKEVKRDCIY